MTTPKPKKRTDKYFLDIAVSIIQSGVSSADKSIKENRRRFTENDSLKKARLFLAEYNAAMDEAKGGVSE